MNKLISIAEARQMILDGVPASFAGTEAVLDQLPPGPWIGGTIPYFMAPEGGVVALDRVFVTTLPEHLAVSVAHYDPAHLGDVVARAPANGFTVAIIPAGGEAHTRFAHDASGYPDAFVKPTVGWISGVPLAELGSSTAKVYDGRTATKHGDGIAALHVTLAEDRLATVDIVNIFAPDDGAVIRFREAGFGAHECLVDGQPRALAAYMAERGNSDCRLPLVGDFAGAHINVSLQAIDAASGQVSFYAPVFPGVDYRLARPPGDYAATFRARLAAFDSAGAAFSCNCILNFLYGELEGKSLGDLHGPVTFGEIAYQLLNQTMVVLRVI